jgi:hypothetical protein
MHHEEFLITILETPLILNVVGKIIKTLDWNVYWNLERIRGDGETGREKKDGIRGGLGGLVQKTKKIINFQLSNSNELSMIQFSNIKTGFRVKHGMTDNQFNPCNAWLNNSRFWNKFRMTTLQQDLQNFAFFSTFNV